MQVQYQVFVLLLNVYVYTTEKKERFLGVTRLYTIAVHLITMAETVSIQSLLKVTTLQVGLQ